MADASRELAESALEPAAVGFSTNDEERVGLSTAISLKRLADALTAAPRGPTVAAAVATGDWQAAATEIAEGLKNWPAEEAARRDKLTDAERNAEDARLAASDSESKAVQARGDAEAEAVSTETTADEVKSVSSKTGDLGIGELFTGQPPPLPRSH